ncbi:MAG: UDP-N-acetylmuramoyl-tripeptide--D-alanyl-D-alanine ligase [Bacteroidota bacterium]
MNINELYRIYLAHPDVQTDTRKIKPGQLFFALKGDQFNGNLFAARALEQGAAFCIVDEETGIEDNRIIRVKDVLDTLQQLAKTHRSQFQIPFIAITGSNGKTTTKELIHAVLSSTFKTYTTEGNLNNHIGIPLTILKIKSDAEIAVIEMGANHQKEIEGYCKYAMPTHGLITNCGKAHLEGFGGVDGVRKGKGELFDFISETKGTAFVFSDYDYLIDMSVSINNRVFYGSNASNLDYNHSVIGETEEGNRSMLNIRYATDKEKGVISTHLVGDYNLPNVLAAYCIGSYFGIGDGLIVSAIESYEPSNSRSQLVEKNGNRIILDAYNANPSSMKLAIENFVKMPEVRKILMLGGMMELGEETDIEHQKLVDLIGQYEWEQVVLVGKQFKSFCNGYLYFEDSEKAAEWYRSCSYEGIAILLKGSRSMKMEKVIE